MGRLDDAAKHKVVELREAGLSFRKIKAVLELENIKVSTQSIYLFLREFQGRPTGRAQPVKSRSNTSTTLVQSRAGTIQENRSNVHQNLLREFQKQTSLNPETGAKPPRYGETSRGSTSDRQHEADKEDNDIRIVSVTSLAQNRPQSIVTGAQSDIVTSTLTAPGSLARRRVTPSPATSSTLAARKRILDKALTQRMKQSFHQVASLLKKDHLSVQGSNLRSALPQATETYDLTNEKTVLESQSGGREGGVPKRSQKMGLSPRSPHPLPRVGIRLPSRPPAALPSSAPGPPIIRLKGAGGQVASCSERNPSPQQAAQDHGERGGLQDQIQTLGSEVRSLGVAVEKLVEHQCRMEREQAQQTHIQKQILTILQSIAIKLRQSSSSQQHHNNTPSPSTLPKAPAATSFSQDNFSFSQGTYTHCSQSQPSYNSVESLENVETFKLPTLNPAGMNGFHENLPLPHTPPQTQPYAAPVYTDQTSQTLMPPYTQSYISTYNQSQMQSFRISGSKSFDLPSTCATGTLQDCTMSTQTAENSTLMPQDPHLSVIKVEGP